METVARQPSSAVANPVKDPAFTVKNPSRNRLAPDGGFSFGIVPSSCEGAAAAGPVARAIQAKGADMSVLVFVALTVAAFAILGLLQRLVERL